MDIGNAHQGVLEAGAARVAGEIPLVAVQGLVVLALGGIVLGGLEQADVILRVGRQQLLHDPIRRGRVEAGQGDVSPVDLVHDGIGVRQAAQLGQVVLRLISAPVCQQIVDQVETGQPERRVLLHQLPVEVDGVGMVVHVPVPVDVAVCLHQDPLAALHAGVHPNALLGVTACLAAKGLHPVPVEIGQQIGGALLVGFDLQLVLQKGLVLQKHVLGQIVLRVQPVFDAVEALLAAQVKEIVDGDAEDLRQQGQGAAVGHGHRVFPLGHGLGADAQPLRQLLLGQAGLEAKLFDFLSEFHNRSLRKCCLVLLTGLS